MAVFPTNSSPLTYYNVHFSVGVAAFADKIWILQCPVLHHQHGVLRSSADSSELSCTTTNSLIIKFSSAGRTVASAFPYVLMNRVDLGFAAFV